MAEEILAAWVGGSFSPPTNAHVDVILTIGAKLKELSKGKQVYVYITPVSQGYKKRSIECISLDNRRILMAAFIEAIQSKAPKGVSFILNEYEMNSATPVITADSLLYLKDHLENKNSNNPKKTIKLYLAQGQDNIEQILRRKWSKPEVLDTYPLLMFPRGDGGFSANLKDNKRIKDIITIEIPPDFREETSSSEVRSLFRRGKTDEAYSILHPLVANALKGLPENPYESSKCDPPLTNAVANLRKQNTRKTLLSALNNSKGKLKGGRTYRKGLNLKRHASRSRLSKWKASFQE
jgi:nicotinic acid mononucleotide adenylyltransferase